MTHPTQPTSPYAALRRHSHHIWHLGIKEFHSLLGDWTLLFLIAFMFSLSIYADARAKPESLHRAAIAIVDEDQSQLSSRLIAALQAPQFITPELITLDRIDPGLDSGRYTFILDIPPNFERDVMAGRSPSLQLNVDATRQSQAQTGTGYIQSILSGEINAFVQRFRSPPAVPVEIVERALFNPNLKQSWFAAVTAVINNITMLGILLTGAALIREREHGTIEHLLVMPVTPFEIMLSKVWTMGVVVLLASSFSLQVVVKGALGVSVPGSTLLFGVATLIYLFAAASIGIFMGTLARNMPQFGLMSIIVLLPLQILSGALTPRESMPELIRMLMSLTPTTHYVSLAQGILFRGAGLDLVWPSFLAMLLVGSAFFYLAHQRLRKTIGQM